MENGVIETYPIFRLQDGALRAVASELPSAHKFTRAGYSPASLIHDDAPASTASDDASRNATPADDASRTGRRDP